MARLFQPSLDRRSFLAGSLAATSLVMLHPVRGARPGQPGASAHDGNHRHPCRHLPYDYYADQPNDTMGLARTAALINLDPRRSRQLDADRQWRPPAGQPDGRLHRL